MQSQLSLWAQEMAGPDPVKAKAAKAAMAKLAHSAAAPRGDRRLRAQLVRELVTLANSAATARLVRAHALHLIGCIGGRGELRAIAGLESHPELGDNARMATERLRRGG